VPVGTKSPLGDGRWGHADLAGNRGEWTLDWLAPYLNPCNDCARTTPPPIADLPEARLIRVFRGDEGTDVSMMASGRDGMEPIGSSYSIVGMRCARAP
jgi:formylglycine-generating enzyme required for sulfatase activity